MESLPVTELTRWYTQHHRKLPWRETTDPYAIWVSEVMLQQTQVKTVLPYYARFLGRFPDVRSLSEAKEAEVLQFWSGLGYYSRARNLHRGAKYLLKIHQGEFPKTIPELRKIPGIGPYTAGAVSSIAFNHPEPIVDGNVQRVFARFYGMKRALPDSKADIWFWQKAREWVSQSAQPRILNQALMELGATRCTKAAPQCSRCPLSQGCVAFKKNLQDRLPQKKARRKTEQLWWVPLVLQHKNQFYLIRNPKGSWWEGMWDLPRLTVKHRRESQEQVDNFAKKEGHIEKAEPLATQKHTVTHHKIEASPYHLKANRKKITQVPRGRWFSPKEISKLPASSLVKKVFVSMIE